MAKRDHGFRRIPPPRPPPTGTELCGPDHGVGLVIVEDALRRFDVAWVAAMGRERATAGRWGQEGDTTRSRQYKVTPSR